MVFSSHLFIFYFLPLALLGYFLFPLQRARNLVLTVFSYVFYGWANPILLVLLLASTTVDYLCGLVISKQWDAPWTVPIEPLREGTSRSGAQTAALVVSVSSNLLLLGFFKYFNFAVESLDSLVSAFGLHDLRLGVWYRIALPLGISFYTFQSMSYSIDVYRGKARAIRNPVDFACYVAMFPQLVAGPIIRFRDVAGQLTSRSHSTEKFARGISFICFGLAKKILLANPCGQVADLAFGAGSVGVLDAWFGVTAFAFQIYFDFSGYSDIAIGLGLLFGFVFYRNFDSPYHARSITELWRRWHISLSNWFRDYLYIPLGGSRKGEFRTYVNLATVMLLGGLWHGASWNFAVWGALHGTILILERRAGKRAMYWFLPGTARTALTFALVLFGWVFFRSPELASALRYSTSMLGFAGNGPGAGLLGGMLYKPYHLLTMAAAAAVVWGGTQTWEYTRRITWPKTVIALALFMLSLAMMTVQAYNPFIYFVF